MDISKFVLSDDALNIIDNGAWVGDLTGAEGVRLLVTGLTRNREAQKALRKAARENRGISDEERADLAKRVMATHVLKGWEGFTQDGKELPYDKETATKWLTSRNGEGLAALVLEAATRIDEDAASFVEDAAKNS